MRIIKEWINNRKLIMELAKNDFFMRYAGSYFGTLWAFVQPVVTVLLYVFVFQIAFHANPSGDYPYVLWLIAGLIPWMFFSESITLSTSCFLEYSYLVKKVVFPVSILPIIKVISSTFVHIFFVLFSFGIYCLMGKVPGIHFVQFIYYFVCLLLLVIGCAFITSTIVPFFRDFLSIVNIAMSVGVWFTPILWNLNDVNNQIVNYIMYLNPVYYIVNGYRESFMNGFWFWQHPGLTAIFWAELIIIYAVGISSFYKMKSHFADVL